MSVKFLKGVFLLSTLATEKFPKILNSHGVPLFEVAMVGRSNVGKSSLINHLLRYEGLARVSARPGKTQTLNFFNVDEKLCLVDLPGYGFAKAPKELRDKWGESIDAYLRTREELKLLIILLDCRHKPSQEDIDIILWAHAYQKPFLLVLTKSDKLKAKEKKEQKEKVLSALMDRTGLPDLKALTYSVKNQQTRQLLIHAINESLQQEEPL